MHLCCNVKIVHLNHATYVSPTIFVISLKKIKFFSCTLNKEFVLCEAGTDTLSLSVDTQNVN